MPFLTVSEHVPTETEVTGLKFGPGRIALTYALVAALWILVSDALLEFFTQNLGQVQVLGSLKGVGFVVLTSLILYRLMKRMIHELAVAHHQRTAEQDAKIRVLKLLEVVTEKTSDAIFVKDSSGRYMLFNHHAARFVGKAVADIIGKDDYAIFPTDEAAMLQTKDRQIIASGQVSTDEETLTSPMGLRTVLVTKGPIYDEQNHLMGVFGIARDITQRKLAEQALRRSEEQYRALFQNMLGGFAYHEVIYDGERPVDYLYLAVNDNFEALTGLKNVVGKRISEVLPMADPSDRELAQIYFRVAMTGKPERFERYVNALNQWFSISVFSLDPRHFAVMFDNISDRKLAEERVAFLAYHDALTGLPNRSLAADRMQVAMAYADRGHTMSALLSIDLDNFKAINESIDHRFGDHLLRQVAARFGTCIRDTDTISRQGGDEFLIVLSNLPSVDEASMVAEKILHSLSDPFVIDDHRVSISASIGISVYPLDGRDFETLLKNADNAMGHAKELGRNTYHFYDVGLNLNSQEQWQLHNDLAHAVERGEFVLHYQPQIDMASGQIVGAEALIRWNHPTLGLIMPGRFVSIAEDRGVIVPMGDWVLREACAQMAKWRRSGMGDLVVAVNLSALQFKRGNLEDTVARALNDANLEASALELELTESILIKDVDRVLAKVERLKALGVKLSIDDFGTGYSSLSYLKRFKVDKLKVDQSFVRDLVVDPEDATIVRTIIQMADGLNLRTIAEGVENEETLHRLRRMGCQEAQGYYFSRPLTAEDFARYVESRTIEGR